MFDLLKRNTPDWRLMAGYLAGECTESEREEVEARIAADEAFGRRFDELQRIWEASEGATEDVLSDGAAWQLLSRRLRKSEGPSAASPIQTVTPSRRAEPHHASRPGPARRRRARFRGRRSWGGASVLVLVVLAGVLAALFAELQPASPTGAQVIETAKGERSLIRLPGGTQVTLNAGSRLTLPAGGFAEDRRVVTLEGEAYFKVAPGEDRPFLVRTQDASVRVLGTAFVVQAYADKPAMAVAVAEGQVALQPGDAGEPDTTVVLESHQLGVVSATGRLRAVHRGIDLTPYLAWTNGRLVFNDAPFDEVAQRLERWYDLRVDVQIPVGQIGQLDASFEGMPLGEVLDAIAAALDLQYEKDRQVVTFYRPRSDPSVRITK